MDTMYCSYSSSTLLDYYNFYYWKDIINFYVLATTVEEDKTGLDQLVHGEKAYFYGELNKLHKRY